MFVLSHLCRLCVTCFADFDPSRASRFGRGGRLLVTARDNGSIVRKEIFDEIAYLDFLVHNISIEWKGQRLQYGDICSTWRGKCWKNEVHIRPNCQLSYAKNCGPKAQVKGMEGLRVPASAPEARTRVRATLPFSTELEVFVDKTVRGLARGQTERGNTRCGATKCSRFHAPFYPEIYTSQYTGPKIALYILVEKENRMLR